MQKDLANRSIDSVKWNSISNIVSIIIGFLKSIVLARLLPVETFGVVAGAASIVILTVGFSIFGLSGAFVFRSKETEDVEHTARVHFTLQQIINIIWTIIMIAGGIIFIKPAGDGFLIAFIAITLSKTFMNFMSTPRYLLARLVEHRRLALINMFDVILSFIVAFLLALAGQPLWSLLSTYFVTNLVNFIFLYLWHPIWHPRLKWSRSTVKYFLNFGSKQLVGNILLNALDRVDELWTKIYLGSLPLGFYSKAYTFASYPGSILANPISIVATGAFSEISHNRKKLSDAFRKVISFLIRSGFYLAGLLTLIAPEFINIFLGEKWMPMLISFRLMLPFTLFDPMKQTISNIFLAVGKPEIIAKIRFVQLIIMVVFLFFLGNLFNIEGVALAVDLMMVVGIIISLIIAKRFVDFSIRFFFGIPLFSLIMGLIFGFSFDHYFSQGLHNIVSGLIKIIGFSIIYIVLQILFEYEEIKNFINMLNRER